MLSFLSEAQFAYGPRAPRQSGYSGFGAVTGTAKRGLCRPANSFTESSNEISGVQACRPVPTSGTGRKRFQVGVMIDNHLIYPTAPDMRLEAERQPRGSSKRNFAPACLLAPCMDAWKITMIMVDLLKCFILPRCNNLFIFWLYHDSFCLILEVIFGILVHLKDFTKTHVRL